MRTTSSSRRRQRRPGYGLRAGDIAWDTGKNPKGQRLFKLKDNKVYISSAYELSAGDEDTGVRIVPSLRA